MKKILTLISILVLALGCMRIPSVSAEPNGQVLSLNKCPMGYLTVITGNYNKAPAQQCLSDQSETIKVPVDSAFSINLPVNPTTGATWGLWHMPDSVILLSAGLSTSTTNQTEVIGSGGEFSYTFRVMGQGSGTIKLGYGRPWENDVWSARMVNIKTR